MKNSILIPVVTLFIAVAATAGFFLARSDDPQASVVRQLQAELVKTRDEMGRLKMERDHLVASARKTEPGVTAGEPATQPLLATAQAVPEPAASSGDPRKLTGAPAVREMLHKQQELQVDMTYGRLFQKFALTDEQQTAFKRLLSASLAAQTDIKMKMMDPNITEAGRKAVAAQLDMEKQQSDAAIHQFLNNEDDFNTYKGWEDTKQERLQLQLGGANFDMAGVPLTDDQREQLVAAMASARKSPGTVPDPNDPRNVSLDSLNSDGISRALAMQDANDGKVLNNAAGFLSPPQVEALKKMQQQMRVLIEAGMRTTGQTFGAGRKG
ncbi:MAG: hypothetical protein JWO94_2095 [Verrucomicrobiaceae bacterium]|nr:hypothetical protein [Verrucomicrobiaceae bacterium]